jgi:hypothetical protein
VGCLAVRRGSVQGGLRVFGAGCVGGYVIESCCGGFKVGVVLGELVAIGGHGC